MTNNTDTGVTASTQWPYAGFWRRVAAYTLDNLILLIPVLLVGAVSFGLGSILLILFYGAYFESAAARATWGKQAMGIRVETVDGAKLDFGMAFVRQLIKMLANVLSVITWLIFFLPAAFTEHKQGLHDFAASSVVRHEPGRGAPVWAVLLLAGLLPAVFVLGILAAIAIPAYQDYVMRATIAGARSEAAPLRRAIEEHFDRNGALPGSDAKLPAVHSTMKDVVVGYDRGSVAIGITRKRQSGTIYLTPEVVGQGLVWRCSAEGIRASQLPADCR